MKMFAWWVMMHKVFIASAAQPFKTYCSFKKIMMM